MSSVLGAADGSGKVRTESAIGFSEKKSFVT